MNDWICLAKRCFTPLDKYLKCLACGRQHLLIDGKLKFVKEK